MSLWQKPMSEITFEDIDAFCSAKHREGTRYDYKLRFPSKLEKTIAAFANTLGGLILIGIDSDRTTNTPIWPAMTGLPSEAGLEERVYQKATEAIYPPVRVTASPVIENPNLPGNVIIVIRVDESKDAPHAVDDGRKVFVYERSENKTDPIQLAKVDRIEHLLNRRRAIEGQRDASRSAAMERAENLLDSAVKPFMWVSVAPKFPWRQLCQWGTCHNFLLKAYSADRVRRIPSGALYVSEDSIFLGAKNHITNLRTITCDATGHFLYMRSIFGDMRMTDERYDLMINLNSFTQRFHEMLDDARRFYREPEMERPGLMAIQIGCLEVKGLRIYEPSPFLEATRYLDDKYVDQMTVTADEFLSEDEWPQIHWEFCVRIAHSFNVKTERGL
jgi:hypothetical protein